MAVLTTCSNCGADLPSRRAGPGRPARYCSTGCRRETEFELRRLDRAIERAESVIQRHRRMLDGVEYCGSRDSAARGLEWWEAELARLNARLRTVLDDREADL